MNAIQILSSQPWVERLGWTLIQFLWQGALLAALYAITRPARTAQTRYLLGCAALAAMVAAPVITFTVTGASQLTPANPFVGTIPISSSVANNAPVPSVAFAVLPTSTWNDNVLPSLVAAWFAGVLAFWLRLTGGCFAAERMKSKLTRPAAARWQATLHQLKIRIGISRPVRLLTSALVQVPAVIGWLRPVVLMPIGALAGLPVEQVEALLAHELAHVRRHDYLINILQSLAEALLFYHPAVWWISNHIRNERELCCDDIVVAITADTLNYARALADLESHRPAHLNAVLTATGGSLKDRIARLVGQSRNPSRTLAGPGILAVILIAIPAYGLVAQSQTATQSFEAVSIKPNNLSGSEVHEHNSPGRLNAQMSTRHLMRDAFGIQDFQIAGEPGWLGSVNYDFIAKTPAPLKMTDQALEPYLQSLLADRFHLKYHRETKQVVGFSLVTSKGGSKLTKHAGTAGEDMEEHGGKDKVTMAGTKISMAVFAASLSRELSRPVIDNTKLEGEFDFKLEWSPEQLESSSGSSIFAALQEQLGLRLESGKVPVEILVIDSIEKPTEN